MAGEKLGNLGQISGYIIDFSFKSGFSHGSADKKKFERKPPGKRWIINIIGQGVRKHLIYHNVLHGKIHDHGPNQMLWLSAPGADKYPAAFANMGNSFLCAHDFMRAICMYVHRFSLFFAIHTEGIIKCQLLLFMEGLN